MTSIDLIVLAILAGSVVVGLIRGFVREVFSLGAWVVAFFAAKDFSPYLAPHIPGVGEEGLRYVAAIAVIFVVVLVLATLAGTLLAGMVRWAGLGVYDKGMGMFFGLLRAVAVLLGLTLLVGLTAMPRTDVWRQSLVHAPLEAMALRSKPWLPEKMAALIRFERPEEGIKTGPKGASRASGQTRGGPNPRDTDRK